VHWNYESNIGIGEEQRFYYKNELALANASFKVKVILLKSLEVLMAWL